MGEVKESPDVRLSLPRCPYCHDEIHASDEKHGCDACMAWHHRACWSEAGERCATCGHPTSRPERQRAPRGVTTVAPTVDLTPIKMAVSVLVAFLAGAAASFIFLLIQASLQEAEPGPALAVLGGVLVGALVLRWLLVAPKKR